MFHLFVLFSIILVIITASFFSFKLKNRFDHSYGMMVSMLFGTNIGLTIGVLFGSIYQESLFKSTLISVSLGVFAGSICGLAFGIMGWLEGFMAGLMSSMMGAMLGAMLAFPESEIMIKISLTLSVCTLLLFLIIPKRQIKDSIVKRKSWLLKPFLTIIIICSYLILGAKLTFGG